MAILVKKKGITVAIVLKQGKSMPSRAITKSISIRIEWESFIAYFASFSSFSSAF